MLVSNAFAAWSIESLTRVLASVIESASASTA